MYLTDCRERSLKDVITQLEPGLFKKVTGLDVKDFELLCSLGVFNASLMNDAIFKFKRYEDSSLSYTGINKHENEDIGGWDTVIKRKEYEQLFYNQQATMSADNLDEVTDDDDAIDITVETNQLSDFQTKDKAQIKESDLVTSSYGISQSINSKTSKPMTIQKSENFNLPDIKVGDTVQHKLFGTGTVSKIDKAQKYIYVRFDKGEKMFVFDYVFKNGLLTLV